MRNETLLVRAFAWGVAALALAVALQLALTAH